MGGFFTGHVWNWKKPMYSNYGAIALNYCCPAKFSKETTSPATDNAFTLNLLWFVA